MSADRSAVPTVDESRFRQVLGHFATGVTVITAATEDGPIGLAVGSFFSVSLDPPLVAFCAAKTSNSFPKIRTSGHFAVNILAEDQENVCRTFASKAPDKFSGIGYGPAPASAAPLVQGALAWVECELYAVHEAGDHWIVVGRVLDLGVTHEGQPLMFFRGGYGRFVP